MVKKKYELNYKNSSNLNLPTLPNTIPRTKIISKHNFSSNVIKFQNHAWHTAKQSKAYRISIEFNAQFNTWTEMKHSHIIELWDIDYQDRNGIHQMLKFSRQNHRD